MDIPVMEGTIAKRTLHFFWIVDCSGSMEGKKIASLNQAIRETIPEIKKVVASHPEVQIKMRAIQFSDTASWLIGPDAVPVEDFIWSDVTAHSETATAKAIRMLAGELEIEKMSRRGYPPVCILLSDGFCTDPVEEYEAAIQQLNSLPWGRKAVRLVIAIGNESEYDEEQLLKFVSHKEIGVLHADTPEKLTEYIKWASVSASVGASVGKSNTNSDLEQNVVLPAPPAVTTTNQTDVF
ncbi:VWA domain-containing protein [Cohnella sp. GbtcB17]|uniref:vWA domain-containing protein n=1 Tax=Cohnella sp. GbtcB17 TaxID=2824762 RepID=UPI001C30F9A9|nr:VWA domain-containing protein [Cohnella sp. GbtcB17]